MVDRGPYSIEIIYIIYLLFLINNTPKNYRVIILNGNHEERNQYTDGGLQEELDYQFIYIDKDKDGNNIPREPFLEKTVSQIHNILYLLPQVLFIKYKSDTEYIQYCHGGISEIQRTDDIANFLKSPNTNKSHSILVLPSEYDPDGNKIDSWRSGFLWSDFTEGDTSYKYLETRGSVIGNKDLEKIIKHNNIKLIISEHQDLTALGLIINKQLGIAQTETLKNLYPVDNQYDGIDIQRLRTLQELKDYKIELDNDDNPKLQEKSIPIDKKVIAITISTATAAKQIPYDIFGIIDKNNINIIWKNTCTAFPGNLDIKELSNKLC